MRTCAGLIRAIRLKLIQLRVDDLMPPWSVVDSSTVEVLGLDVAAALEALCDTPPQRTPTHIDERC
jgi:hypothetical protein